LYANCTINLSGRQINAVHFASLSDEEKILVYQWRTSPEIANMMRTQKFSMSEHLDFISGLKNKTSDFYWLVKDSEKALGVIYLNGIKDGGAELGIYAGAGIRGAGFTLMQTLYHLAFRELKLDTIRANVYADNTAARKLYERCGMTLEPGKKADCADCDKGETCVYVINSAQTLRELK